MKPLFAMVLALASFGATHADDQTLPIPSSVISDPAPDPVHPPRSAQVLVPSHGLGMSGLFYLAGGAGPHPTIVILHGFPGKEQNLDLAQAVRRAGWNVPTLHYRGAGAVRECFRSVTCWRMQMPQSPSCADPT